MESRAPYLRRALLLSAATVAWNGVAGGAAVVIALATGSLALLGFGCDAAIDSVASVALVWRFATESREPQRAERVERGAALVVGGVLVVLGIYLALASVRALLEHAAHDVSIPALGLLVASAAVLPPLGLAKYRTARRLDSGALRADSVLTLVGALLAGIGLLSAVLTVTVGLWWADALGGVIVSMVLLREGSQSLRDSRAASANHRATL
jgi:divalent metal cation (Fe/Co/Zn/Cd) transporter